MCALICSVVCVRVCVCVCVCVFAHKQYYNIISISLFLFYVQAFKFLPHGILAPIHTIAVTLLLWFYVGLGPSCLPGIGLLLLQMPLQYFVGKFYAKLR